MILEEATVGGVVYVDYIEREMKLPEQERVAFLYRALTNREKIQLIHDARGKQPNGAEVASVAVTGVKNLKGKPDKVKKDGVLEKMKTLFGVTDKTELVDLDTIEKVLVYPDKGMELAYMVEVAGVTIWKRQSGEEVELKN